jgi:hypothetical protein
MQSHSDSDAATTLRKLEERAKSMVADGTSQLTAGKPGEEPIREEQVGSVFIRQLPDDPQALRISIGEAPAIEGSGYFVFRGSAPQVLELLERALTSFREYCS